MASVDKIYVRSYEQYLEFKEFISLNLRTIEEETLMSPYIFKWSKEEFEESLRAQEENFLGINKKTREILELGPDTQEYKNYFGYLENGKEEWTIDEDRIKTLTSYLQIEGTQQMRDLFDVPISNFPERIDRWLIQNCQIPFIVSRLRGQYSDFEDIKNKTDIYSQPYIYEPATRVTILKNTINRRFSHYHSDRWRRSSLRMSKSELSRWRIVIEEDQICRFTYTRSLDRWFDGHHELPIDYQTSVYYGRSIKALIRKIRKWKLPKGLRIKVETCYEDEELILITK